MDESEVAKVESHVSCAAAFVEGGVQEPCDDSCSICLEDFCESDPSTGTSCKHEFHLQCILEWCQRSSQCPMCWQPISLKDSTSQELFEAVERERNIRSKRPRSRAIFHHPALGDFELQHLPVGVNAAELEERIFQHLAAAAAMGRAHLARREGRHGRSDTNSRPQYLVFSADANSIPSGPIVASSDHRVDENEPTPLNAANLSSATHNDAGGIPSYQTLHATFAQYPQPQTFSFGSNISTNSQSSSSQPNQENQDRGEPSDTQSFSDSFKSRLTAVSMKYKDSIAKSTRGWRERLFSRNNSVSDISSDIRKEINAGMATVSRMIDRLDMRENNREHNTSESRIHEVHAIPESRNEGSAENQEEIAHRNLNASSSCNTTPI